MCSDTYVFESLEPGAANLRGMATAVQRGTFPPLARLPPPGGIGKHDHNSPAIRRLLDGEAASFGMSQTSPPAPNPMERLLDFGMGPTRNRK